ncbi:MULTISPECIES: hypothetical protein [Buttiauxella]|jgi:hypothetical protein|uniref:FidL-like membrane protein n=1 Tax=Buttiauxella ferragutiae ATCC 51602 TaxID=1354252 RepID=A0ABX2W9S5_9ENTR|nr:MULTISPECIES: hypothetical protein [Buttiauxella]AYN29025.1 hypothetical protein D8682_19785 [Buttiauxella sp. 3AFRM03]MCE0827402.1 hypothetical protein [Buttiauxella ferragutiae]OAT28746.1 hypothetical protein M976_01687 [Buttiauxella ferragutiae ATCC 51602]TDN52935.1 hypothetical protein EC843_102372 [Buttiauxella sp. JUb87]UNK62137.1 hypothetical protein MNO13_04040 [Buttiauxella ferragutiae]
MKIFTAISSLRTQTRVIFLVCVAIVTGLAVYLYQPPNDARHNLVCRATLQINRDKASFRGIIDFKSGDGKGIAHINGIINVSAQEEYTVQRTILFTHADYGLSPVWVSRQIIVSNRETAPSGVLQQFLPDFYLKSAGVTDIDIFTLNKDADLITREGIPYLYCQKYMLPEDE